MRFSVVIPTCDRSDKLSACLKALFNQDFDKAQFEIIVIDDGSQDNTQRTLKRLQKSSPVPLYVFFQPNQGQAVARNKGIAEARGDVILFLGDDIIAAPECLREHDRLHKRHPEENAACLGFIAWHPGLRVTPLMEFMEKGGALFGRFGGHQFAYDLLKGRKIANYRFFYTSNISLKRSILEHFRFDTWFSGYGWEDIELGYRLEKKAGLVLYYEPSAIVYHDHEMNEDDFVRRMRDIGFSSHILHKKYPELGSLPNSRKKFIFRLLSSPLSLFLFKRVSKNLYFYGLSKKYFLQGVEEGYNKTEL